MFAKQTDSEVESVFAAGPLVRLNPNKKGWGPAAGFNWLTADLDNPSGSMDSFARLRVRPLMAGIIASGVPRQITKYARNFLGWPKRYALSADSAVRGTNRKVATLLGRLALL